MSLGRRTEVTVEWAARDITRDLVPHLVGLTYADNLSGAADDLQLELEDRGGLWSGDWRPTFSDSVTARIKVDAAEAWLTGIADFRLGKFAHDQIEISGPPRKATLKCVSAPMATGLRRRKRTKAWSGVTLEQIARDIADRADLTLAWDGRAGSKYKHRAQKEKTDLEFLTEAAKEIGRVVKVTEDKLVVFDELQCDKATPAGTIDLAAGHVIGWHFSSGDSDRYGRCLVSFFNPRTGKLQKGEYVDQSNPDGQTLEMRISVDDQGQATDKAKALLRNANRFATKGKLTVDGDPGLVAGVTFDLTGAYGLDGKFIITKAEHHPVGGYTVALDVRRCMEGY